MSEAKVTLPKFRISQAAVGRRLASVLLRVREGELSEEEFLGTINAVFDSCVEEVALSEPSQQDERYSGEENEPVNEEILAAERKEIEKSVRRSEGARKAAVRRRELREERRKQAAAQNAENVKKAVEDAVAEVRAQYRYYYEGVYRV